MNRSYLATCICCVLVCSTLRAADPKPGEEKSFEIAEGVKVVFCWVPAGECQLGSPQAEREAVMKLQAKLDKKGREVVLALLSAEAEEQRGKYQTKGFWLGKYTVTQGEYAKVMTISPSYFDPSRAVIKDAGYKDTSHFPVESVSWDHCQKFLKECKLKGLRLPHEDEWEYACRGGKGNKQPFYWGDELNGDKANCNGKRPYGTLTEGVYLERTTEVWSYAKAAPHPWGLCDMSGNVRQWCDNWYDSKQKDRVTRGGAWVGASWTCRTAYRVPSVPYIGFFNYGFRLFLPAQ